MKDCVYMFATLIIVYTAAVEEKWSAIEILLMQSQPVSPGENVTFYCKIPGSNNLTQQDVYRVKLLREGENVDMARWNKRKTGAEFLIKRVSKKDEGTYSCQLNVKNTFVVSRNWSSVFLRVRADADEKGSNSQHNWFVIVLAAVCGVVLLLSLVVWRILRKPKRRRAQVSIKTENSELYYNLPSALAMQRVPDRPTALDSSVYFVIE
ncbi:uncharacterized protein LOC136718912 [Amia ocellicauda]|uniref:uncharacterized protein LOC136718912 n=1 Tax=Amia ocellicauda TaxID=2972642 RepID=UPI003464B218